MGFNSAFKGLKYRTNDEIHPELYLNTQSVPRSKHTPSRL